MNGEVHKCDMLSFGIYLMIHMYMKHLYIHKIQTIIHP